MIARSCGVIDKQQADRDPVGMVGDGAIVRGSRNHEIEISSDSDIILALDAINEVRS